MGESLSKAFIDPEGLLGCKEENGETVCPFDPSDPDWAWGMVQVLFLMAGYGYVLFKASNMLADGSELLVCQSVVIASSSVSRSLLVSCRISRRTYLRARAPGRRVRGDGRAARERAVAACAARTGTRIRPATCRATSARRARCRRRTPRASPDTSRAA